MHRRSIRSIGAAGGRWLAALLGNDGVKGQAYNVSSAEVTTIVGVIHLVARAMGMTSTTFKNANGLTRTGHLSTARDMSVLGRRLVYDFPQYYNIFGRTSTSAGIATVKNTNRRVLEAYAGADGIKTGYTRASGFNLMTSARTDDQHIVAVVLGGRSGGSRDQIMASLVRQNLPRAYTGVRQVPVVAEAPAAELREDETLRHTYLGF